MTTTGLLVHGFDVPLDRTVVFEAVSDSSQSMLASIGMELVPMETNLRSLCGSWEDSFAAAVASCLTVLKSRFDGGMIGSSEPYDALVLPWGSNPLTDPLLGSDGFGIRHDGAEASRLEKLRVLLSWPEAMAVDRKKGASGFRVG